MKIFSAWSLAPMDITKCCVSFLEILYSTFTAAICSCCVLVGLSVFCFVFSDWKVCSVGLRSGDGLGNWKISHFFTMRNSWLAFAACFGLLSIYTVKCCLISFAAFGWICAESLTLHFTIHPIAAVTSSINTSTGSSATDWQPVQGVPCLSYYGIWIRLLPHSDPELDKQKEMGGCKLILVSCIQFQNCAGSCRCFWSLIWSSSPLQCSQWFDPSCKLCSFMKVSLDRRLWQLYVYLL